MAKKRMFTKDITETDYFMDMPLSAQMLYMRLNLHADDDGFVQNPNTITRAMGASKDDMKILIAKKYIIPFESGVLVIRHWRWHNTIKKDRYCETKCLDEKNQITVDEQKTYNLAENEQCIQDGTTMEPQCIQSGTTGLGLGLGLGSDIDLDKKRDIVVQNTTPPKPYKEIVDYLNLRSGKNFSAKTKATQSHINARLAEGYNVQDFKDVIDKKCIEWSGDASMAQYLRPATLFGTKFESYLNQNVVDATAPKKQRSWTFSDLLNE